MRRLDLVLIAVVITGCGSGAGQATSGWVTHSDDFGFELRHPRDWTVETMDQRWIWVQDKDRMAEAVIYPFLAPQPKSANQCVREVPRLLESAFPGVRIESVSRNQSPIDEVVATLAYQAPEVVVEANSESDETQEKKGFLGGVIDSIKESFERPNGKGLALCSVAGRSGMFYAIAAPEELFEEYRATLISILESVEFKSPPPPKPKPPADQGISYARWSDPNENAFSVEVPRGWHIQGGTFRGGSVDVRHAVSLTSPDGMIYVSAGDPNIPPFVAPTASSMVFGMIPGTWYDPGYGNRMMVMPYTSGKDYATHYVRETIGQFCPQVNVSSSRNRPDVTDAINRSYQNSPSAAMGMIQETTAGDVAFTCMREGKLFHGYYFSSTSFVGMMRGFEMSGVWMVDRLYGYVAPKEKVELGEAIVAKMIRTLNINQAWFRAQQQTTAGVSGIVSQTNEDISNIMNDSYWSRQETYNEVYRNWSNATLGLTDVRDEATGETWSVASGSNYYWRRDNTDIIAGEDVGSRPDIDFTLLREF